MNKKGFTLVELLVVIAIIAVLSIVVVPSLITVNKGINERMHDQKVEYIESSAELYGSNNDEIFNGTSEVILYVYQLVDFNYIKPDVVIGEGDCTQATAGANGEYSQKGCVINPVTKKSMNGLLVILRKENAGIVAKIVDENSSEAPTSNNTLVEAVCTALESSLVGQYKSGGTIHRCKCNATVSPTSLIDFETGSAISEDACIIAGKDANNYLKYGSSKANWRVLGIYKIDGYGLSAKMITSDTI